MNRRTESAADKIRTRIIGQRKARASAALVRIEKAHQVAHGAWQDFGLQQPGNTAEEQAFNVASIEAMHAAWSAFCHIYSDEKTALLGPTW